MSETFKSDGVIESDMPEIFSSARSFSSSSAPHSPPPSSSPPPPPSAPSPSPSPPSDLPLPTSVAMSRICDTSISVNELTHDRSSSHVDNFDINKVAIPSFFPSPPPPPDFTEIHQNNSNHHPQAHSTESLTNGNDSIANLLPDPSSITLNLSQPNESRENQEVENNSANSRSHAVCSSTPCSPFPLCPESKEEQLSNGRHPLFPSSPVLCSQSYPSSRFNSCSPPPLSESPSLPQQEHLSRQVSADKQHLNHVRERDDQSQIILIPQRQQQEELYRQQRLLLEREAAYNTYLPMKNEISRIYYEYIRIRHQHTQDCYNHHILEASDPDSLLQQQHRQLGLAQLEERIARLAERSHVLSQKFAQLIQQIETLKVRMRYLGVCIDPELAQALSNAENDANNSCRQLEPYNNPFHYSIPPYFSSTQLTFTSTLPDSSPRNYDSHTFRQGEQSSSGRDNSASETQAIRSDERNELSSSPVSFDRGTANRSPFEDKSDKSEDSFTSAPSKRKPKKKRKSNPAEQKELTKVEPYKVWFEDLIRGEKCRLNCKRLSHAYEFLQSKATEWWNLPSQVRSEYEERATKVRVQHSFTKEEINAINQTTLEFQMQELQEEEEYEEEEEMKLELSSAESTPTSTPKRKRKKKGKRKEEGEPTPPKTARLTWTDERAVELLRQGKTKSLKHGRKIAKLEWDNLPLSTTAPLVAQHKVVFAEYRELKRKYEEKKKLFEEGRKAAQSYAVVDQVIASTHKLAEQAAEQVKIYHLTQDRQNEMPLLQFLTPVQSSEQQTEGGTQ